MQWGALEGFGLTFPVRAFRAEEFEDVDAAAAVGGLEDYCIPRKKEKVRSLIIFIL
jgi:hypothetical protein